MLGLEVRRRRRWSAALALALALLASGASGACASGSSGPAGPPSSAAAPSTTGARATTTTADEGDLRGLVVVVDPGHNGANAAHAAEIARLVDAGGFQKACNTVGAAEGELTESEINWRTALELRSLLEARGAKVVLTRSSDDGWGPCVDQRGLTAERVGADVLVSLHADGADPSGRGFHVIRPAPGPTVTEERSEASADLAARVRGALVAAGLTPSNYVGGDGIVARSDIATVNRSSAPAVMVEAGNVHNPADLELLGTEAGRRRIATGLAEAIGAYLRNAR